jgi:thiamine biosynthesis lipoprotein
MGPSAPPSTSAGADWEAIGTGIVLRVLDPAGVAAARIAVERELAAIDLACSRFRADSELSRLNADAGRSRKVSPLLIEALEVALRGAELTDGDVDPTLGRALELAGYDRDWELLDPPVQDGIGAPPRPRITARVRSGWRSVTLDRDSLAVHVPAGIGLDLGATAKAWAADRAATAAASAASCPVLVGVGGDISTAGDGAPPGGWQIHVTDDHRSSPSAEGQTISIGCGGLATSSTAVRRWSHAGHTMHHIIDPASGLPVTDTWRTVSVAAATCTDANIATTAAIVRGPAAPAWLGSLGLPARLVDWEGHITTLGGWPEESTSPGAIEDVGEATVATIA